MKTAILALISFLTLLTGASASGYERDRMLFGTNAGGAEIGMVNYRHISNGDIRGEVAFGSLGTVRLPFSGEIALTISSAILILGGVLLCFLLKYLNPRRSRTSR